MLPRTHRDWVAAGRVVLLDLPPLLDEQVHHRLPVLLLDLLKHLVLAIHALQPPLPPLGRHKSRVTMVASSPSQQHSSLWIIISQHVK